MREYKFKALFENQRTGIRTWFYVGVGDKVMPEWGARVTEWLQFTGLKDKNGKEIYEGDVVRIDDLGIGIVDYEEGRFAMRQREKRFCWPVYCRIDHSPFVPEVIGNIYENPELLKEGSV